MELPYKQNGDLKPGFHKMTWDEFKNKFNYNEHRSKLFIGIERAIKELKDVGCKQIFMDGSFVSNNTEEPEDFDLCWDEEGVDCKALIRKYNVLVNPGWKRKNMKALYGGDIAPTTALADAKKGLVFLAYFTQDKQGRAKGIISISLI